MNKIKRKILQWFIKEFKTNLQLISVNCDITDYEIISSADPEFIKHRIENILLNKISQEIKSYITITKIPHLEKMETRYIGQIYIMPLESKDK